MATKTSLREALERIIKDKVAGGDADSQQAKEERIWGATGERWFGPTDPIWWVHSDAAMFVGGLTALLVQTLHPLAMAGVAQHSGFRGDPWGRLQRTSDYIAYATFAPTATAEKVWETVRELHLRVHGTAPDGRSYAASDPHLLHWVHTAETWAFWQAHQVFGPQPLTVEQSDAYVQAQSRINEQLGMQKLASSVAQLEADLHDFRPELEYTDAAADTVKFLLQEPPVQGVMRVGYWPLIQAAQVICPPWVQESLGLRPAAGAELLGRQTVRTIRWAIKHPAHYPPWGEGRPNRPLAQ